MRITQNSMNRTQLMGLNDSLGRLQKTQEQLTSGKRIGRASDDPVGTVSAMRLRGDQRMLEQYGENITDGLSRLRAADDALARTGDILGRVRQQVVAAANGVNGPSERKAYAEEIRQLKAAMTQVMNTQYAGRPIFAGTAYDPANTNAFDPATGTFLGDGKQVIRRISDAPGTAGEIDVAVSGDTAVGDLLAGPGGAPGVLDRILADLASGADLGPRLGELDSVRVAMSSAQATIGAKTNRLEGLQDLNGRQGDASAIALSKVEDVDFIKAAMDLNIQSNAYNAALQASAKIIQPSLMDFLR